MVDEVNDVLVALEVVQEREDLVIEGSQHGNVARVWIINGRVVVAQII